MKAIHARTIGGLPQDSLSSPYLHSSSSHLLLEIDLSPTETQVFLYDSSTGSIYLENLEWSKQQLGIIVQALNYFYQRNTCIPEISQKTVLLGVWHFGHFIGDHIHRLISLHSFRTNDTSMPLHISSTQNFVHDLIALFSVDQCLSNLEPQSRPNPQWVRVYRLNECKCYFPATLKSVPISLAQEFLKAKGIVSGLKNDGLNVFLTSGRTSRIYNITEFSKALYARDWLIVNPLLMPLQYVLKSVACAKILISENGSILFNCFMSRSRPYYILASKRCKVVTARDWLGGYVYNDYHHTVARYIYLDAKETRHHPFSDQIIAPVIAP